MRRWFSAKVDADNARKERDAARKEVEALRLRLKTLESAPKDDATAIQGEWHVSRQQQVGAGAGSARKPVSRAAN